eukprot:CAMPEP_0176468188 /NCGR_PEP_ID=MMETSP0127-20121128/38898_1 /TAXON_ID=938130 /ORGANISM="Platyophrya macrostoma, Strain WH" /LENGTH=78 /DNA_ID=CAMNT_0017861617 /DNA_START=142 /DNA_END=378 /DNA_ORIENTATION=-
MTTVTMVTASSAFKTVVFCMNAAMASLDMSDGTNTITLRSLNRELKNSFIRVQRENGVAARTFPSMRLSSFTSLVKDR